MIVIHNNFTKYKINSCIKTVADRVQDRDNIPNYIIKRVR